VRESNPGLIRAIYILILSQCGGFDLTTSKVLNLQFLTNLKYAIKFLRDHPSVFGRPWIMIETQNKQEKIRLSVFTPEVSKIKMSI
jgi:hypothetical protein